MQNANRIRIGALLGAMLLAPVVLATYLGLMGAYTPSAVPGPIMGFYLSSNCSPRNVSQCFFTPANTQQANDCAWTSGQPDINCNTPHFVAGDVGKRAFGYGTCAASANIAANNNNNPITTTPQLTISSFISSTHVQLSGNAANTATVSASFPPGGCFIWGNPDDSGAAAMDTAMQSSPSCAKFFLAAANYLFTTNHFVTTPTACLGLGPLLGSSAGPGNIVYSAGYELEGRGPGPTNIYLPPGFPESGTCTNGLSGHGCFVVVVQGRWNNVEINGGGNWKGYGMADNSILLEMDGPATLDYFNCINFAARPSLGGGHVSYGIGAFMWSQLYQVNLSSCGAGQLVTNVSSSVTIMRMWIEQVGGYEAIGTGELADYHAQNVSQFSRYNFICYDCTVGVESVVDPFGPPFLLVNRGGSAIKWYRGGLSTEGFPPQAQNNIVGYDCVTTAGCLLDVQDAYWDLSQPATGTGYIAMNSAVAGTIVAKNTIVKGTTGGFAYKDVTGSKFLSEGGNILGAMSVNAGSELLLTPSDNLTGATGVTPTCVFTSGGGTTPSCALQAGSTNEKGVIIATTGTGSPGSTGTITLTFLGTYAGPSSTNPVCTYSVDNSGTAWGNEAGTQISTQSTTAPAFNWYNLASGTLTALTASSPYRVAYKCVAR